MPCPVSLIRKLNDLLCSTFREHLKRTGLLSPQPADSGEPASEDDIHDVRGAYLHPQSLIVYVGGLGRPSSIACLWGWLYLATVMDLYSRKIVGWAMEDKAA